MIFCLRLCPLRAQYLQKYYIREIEMHFCFGFNSVQENFKIMQLIAVVYNKKKTLNRFYFY